MPNGGPLPAETSSRRACAACSNRGHASLDDSMAFKGTHGFVRSLAACCTGVARTVQLGPWHMVPKAHPIR